MNIFKSNTELVDNETNSAFHSFFKFINSMLYYKNLDKRTYMGVQDGSKDFLVDIIEKGNVEEFEDFLNRAGVECKLVVAERQNTKSIEFDFGDKQLPFNVAASTGTLSLALFFYWYQFIKDGSVSFLMIDEFDAFYHHELSRLIVEKLLDSQIQFVLTSHNISIMTNDLLRPDCYFTMTKESVNSFSELTSKEIRAAHNLEKMYKAGVFNGE